MKRATTQARHRERVATRGPLAPRVRAGRPSVRDADLMGRLRRPLQIKLEARAYYEALYERRELHRLDRRSKLGIIGDADKVRLSGLARRGLARRIIKDKLGKKAEELDE